MLLSLLLSTICLAAPAAQDPTPAVESLTQWDGETEDAYRRALHLWKVRGKPGEAADALLGIADTQPVTQRAGQSSWVLVLAAGALVEAGRGDEAAALLPGIERGAQGTVFAAAVAAELEALRAQVHGVGLDEAFLNSLIDLLEAEYGGESMQMMESARRDRIRGYQRAVLPYLLAVIDRWQAGEVRQQAAALSIKYGLAQADASFVDGLIQRLEAMSTLGFLAVAQSGGSSVDEEAKSQRLRLWTHFAASPDGDRVRFAKQFFAERFALDDAAAIRVVTALLADTDPRFDEELIPVFFLPNNASADAVQAVAAAARHPEPPVRERARRLLVSVGALGELRALVADGGREDAARYLIALIVKHLPDRGNQSMQVATGRVIGVKPFLQNGLFALIYERATESRNGAWLQSDGPPDGWAWARPHLDEADFRTLLAIAAAAVKDEAGFALAYERGLPSDEAAVTSALAAAEWLPDVFLERLPECGRLEVAHFVFKLLKNHRPQDMSIELAETWGEAFFRNEQQSLLNLFLEHGRLQDAMRLCNWDGIDSNSRGVLITQLLQKASHWWKEPEQLLAAWQKIPDASWRQAVSSAIRGALNDAPAASELDAASLVRLLTALHDAGQPCWIGKWIAATWDGPGRAAVEAFATDEDRLQWLVQGGVGPSQFLYALQRGAPAAWFADDEGSLAVWDYPDDPALVEAARLLLARNDEVAIRLGLLCLVARPTAADALWDLAAPHGADPRFATLASNALADTSHRDALLRLRLAAWELPGLTNRQELFRAIAFSSDSSAVPVLLRATADPDWNIASLAREALDRLKEVEEQRAFWRAWQATGLGTSPQAALLEQARSPNREVRLSAVYALGALQSPETLPLLISLLEDPDVEIAAAARTALAWTRLPPPEAARTSGNKSQEGG